MECFDKGAVLDPRGIAGSDEDQNTSPRIQDMLFRLQPPPKTSLLPTSYGQNLTHILRTIYLQASPALRTEHPHN
jgi:hypothetical protein